jgi:hypothetical protein
LPAVRRGQPQVALRIFGKGQDRGIADRLRVIRVVPVVAKGQGAAIKLIDAAALYAHPQ